MSLTLTYDDTLARVRISGVDLGVLNANHDFEDGITGWVANGGTVSASTAFAHSGTGSALLTPTGSSGTPSIEPTTSASAPVTPGVGYSATAWVYSQVGDTVTSGILWLDASNTPSLVSGSEVTVPANTWTQVGVSGVAPAGTVKGGPRIRMPNTPAATDLLYIDDPVFRPVGPTTIAVERSADGVRWTQVRGGESLPVDNNLAAGPLDDYEFVAGVPNTYRARVLSPAGVLTQTVTATITPQLDSVWLKSIPRPFLNRAVTVVDFGDISRPTRTGVFDVVGRSIPIAVSEVAGSRRTELVVQTGDAASARSLDLFMASGDPVFVHGPADCPVPSMYAVVGEVTQARRSTRGPMRYFTLPLTEVAAPGPGIVGATVTWQSVLNAYSEWGDVITAEDTWQDELELIGDPSEVIVP